VEQIPSASALFLDGLPHIRLLFRLSVSYYKLARSGVSFEGPGSAHSFDT
jgi:hypothetical protein